MPTPYAKLPRPRRCAVKALEGGCLLVSAVLTAHFETGTAARFEKTGPQNPKTRWGQKNSGRDGLFAFFASGKGASENLRCLRTLPVRLAPKAAAWGMLGRRWSTAPFRKPRIWCFRTGPASPDGKTILPIAQLWRDNDARSVDEPNTIQSGRLARGPNC